MFDFSLFTVQRAKDLLTKGKHSEYRFLHSRIQLAMYTFGKWKRDSRCFGKTDASLDFLMPNFWYFARKDNEISRFLDNSHNSSVLVVHRDMHSHVSYLPTFYVRFTRVIAPIPSDLVFSGYFRSWIIRFSLARQTVFAKQCNARVFVHRCYANFKSRPTRSYDPVTLTGSRRYGSSRNFTSFYISGTVEPVSIMIKTCVTFRGKSSLSINEIRKKERKINKEFITRNKYACEFSEIDHWTLPALRSFPRVKKMMKRTGRARTRISSNEFYSSQLTRREYHVHTLSSWSNNQHNSATSWWLPDAHQGRGYYRIYYSNAKNEQTTSDVANEWAWTTSRYCESVKEIKTIDSPITLSDKIIARRCGKIKLLLVINYTRFMLFIISGARWETETGI